jgi:6-phosphogluconolactonase
VAESVAPEIVVAPDLDRLSRAAAERATGIVSRTVAERGHCTVALSGGTTPLTLYALLADEYRLAAPWRQAEWFWGDERCVPPDHAESNYRAARDALLGPLRIPSGMVHRLACAGGAPAGATRYEEILHDRLTAGRFDLVLLGVGADGHTASLFPGSAALEERDRWAVAVTGGPGLAVRERVTVTYPVLNRARTVFVLAAGAAKHPVVARMLAGDRTDPAARVRPDGDLVWFMDEAARTGETAAA